MEGVFTWYHNEIKGYKDVVPDEERGATEDKPIHQYYRPPKVWKVTNSHL